MRNFPIITISPKNDKEFLFKEKDRVIVSIPKDNPIFDSKINGIEGCIYNSFINKIAFKKKRYYDVIYILDEKEYYIALPEEYLSFASTVNFQDIDL